MLSGTGGTQLCISWGVLGCAGVNWGVLVSAVLCWRCVGVF